MAQYITTLSHGLRSVHLSHAGQNVFSSPVYMTGGSVVPSIVFRDGSLRDARQPRHILAETELLRRFHTPSLTRWQVCVSRLNELALAWSLPFRKGQKRRWNELLG